MSDSEQFNRGNRRRLELRETIKKRVSAKALDGLEPIVREYLALSPDDTQVKKLLDQLVARNGEAGQIQRLERDVLQEIDAGHFEVAINKINEFSILSGSAVSPKSIDRLIALVTCRRNEHKMADLIRQNKYESAIEIARKIPVKELDGIAIERIKALIDKAKQGIAVRETAKGRLKEQYAAKQGKAMLPQIEEYLNRFGQDPAVLEIKSEIIGRDAKALANYSCIYGLVSIFLPFGIVYLLAPVAIYRGKKALSIEGDHKNRAIVGVVSGVLALVIRVGILVGMLVSTRNSESGDRASRQQLLEQRGQQSIANQDPFEKSSFSSENRADVRLQDPDRLDRIASALLEGDSAIAMKDFEAYLEAYPQDDLAWALLGHTYRAESMNDKAKSAYESAVRINPQQGDALVGLGIIYKDEGEYQSAIQAYQEAIEIDPNNAHAYSSLVGVLLKINEDQKALEYGKKGYELNSKDPVIASNLAIAYHYNNDIENRDRLTRIAEQLGYEDLDTLARIYSGELTVRDE